MASTRDAYRRRQGRRSTVLGVGGALLIVAAVLLTLADVGADVAATVLGLTGLVLLIAGLVVGSILVAENFRVHENQSYYDDE